MPRLKNLTILVLLMASLLTASPVRAQDDVVPDEEVVEESIVEEPFIEQPPVDPLAIVVGGLESPRRFFVGDDGTLLIASAGRGGDRVGELAPIADAPITGGRTANVTRVQAGCAEVIAPCLPSAIDATGRTFGAADVSTFDGQHSSSSPAVARPTTTRPFPTASTSSTPMASSSCSPTSGPGAVPIRLPSPSR